MRKIFIVINLSILHINANSQTALSFINNDSVKFSYRFTTPGLLDKNYIPSQYSISVKLSKEERIKVKELKKDYWIRLLNDSSTDWAANLILYYLYRKDATLLWSGIGTSRFDWYILDKKKNVRYWKRV